MASSIEYAPTKAGNIQWRRAVGSHVVIFQAGDLKRSTSGVKGLVKIAEAVDGDVHAVMAHRLDIEDGRTITWMAGKAHERLNGSKGVYPKSTLEEDLFLFCDGLWEAWVSSSRNSDWVMGDEEPSAPLWCIPGLVLKGSTAIHFGDAGSGKSTLERLLAQSLQYEITSLFPTIRQGGVVWVNAEEPPDEHSRQFGNVNAALGLERIAPIYTVDARGMAIQDTADRVKAAVEKTQASHIFVDSLSRLAQGASMNENQTATLLVDSLAGLPCSVQWIGHTGQENRHRLSGSKHFENAARLMVRVQGRISTYGVSPELKRGLRLQVTKGNGTAPVPPQFFTLEYHRDFGLKSIVRSSEDEWPVLHCEARFESRGKERECRRPTWDGAIPGVGIRCDRHRDEEDSG